MVLRLLGPRSDGYGTNSYLRDSATEIPFGFGHHTLTVDGVVPGRASTWGQVKSAYRR